MILVKLSCVMRGFAYAVVHGDLPCLYMPALSGELQIAKACSSCMRLQYKDSFPSRFTIYTRCLSDVLRHVGCGPQLGKPRSIDRDVAASDKQRGRTSFSPPSDGSNLLPGCIFEAVARHY